MSLSKRSRIILILLFLGGIAGYVILSYAYKPHKTIEERTVKFTGTVDEFMKKVATDATLWQDVIIELSGEVTSIDKEGFTLSNNAFCQLENHTELSEIQEGQTIKVKARMIGYDDLLEELKLDQTKIIN